MHIHILGICGTFMAGIAVLAKQQGHHVTGSDMAVYPPMSTQLADQGIVLMEGYCVSHLTPRPDCVIIGNAMSRGNPLVEFVMAEGLPYTSGPQWLAEHSLRDKWVLAVSGTHGKTTTSSLLAWILEFAGLQPGFLIGGMAQNFGVSARMGQSPFFVVEADEYDSAFFDKRSKFLHYRPRTLIMNNLEFDHADIFPDLAAIQQQFQYLVRTVPGNGLIIAPSDDGALQAVLARGCWTPTEIIGDNNSTWQAQLNAADGHDFEVFCQGQPQGRVLWSLLGQHNVSNALAAIAAARHAGVPTRYAIEALHEFKGIKRRLEVKGCVKGITVYDDFAHHPTAIATTLAGLRARIGTKQRLVVVLEFASFTMREGFHQERILSSLALADRVLLARPDAQSKAAASALEVQVATSAKPIQFFSHPQAIVDALCRESAEGDHIVIMSNRGFDGIHDRLLTALQDHAHAE